eukprot:254243-Chlamydomonas_euryale.AAC.4
MEARFPGEATPMLHLGGGHGGSARRGGTLDEDIEVNTSASGSGVLDSPLRRTMSIAGRAAGGRVVRDASGAANKPSTLTAMPTHPTTSPSELAQLQRSMHPGIHGNRTYALPQYEERPEPSTLKHRPSPLRRTRTPA